MHRPEATHNSFIGIGGVIYLVIGVCGFFIENPMGPVPIGGNDTYLHLVLGVLLAGAGFMMGGSKAAAAA
jgi:hypothetical protein